MSGRDIVSTRILNKNQKASLGRNGDTLIGEIDGKQAHLTAWEASLIDSFDKAGAQYVEDIGAGTINPLTGLKEFHIKKVKELRDGRHNARHTNNEWTDSHVYHSAAKKDFAEGYPGGMTEAEFFKELDTFNVTPAKLRMIQDSGFEKPFEFLKQEELLGGQERDIERDKARAGFDLSMEGFDLSMERSEMEADTQRLGLDQQYGQSFTTAISADPVKAAQSGFARGPVGMAQDQLRSLVSDYGTATGSIRDTKMLEQKGIGLEQKGAETDLDFSLKQIDADMRRDRHDFEVKRHEERKRQLDEFYAQLGSLA